MARSIQDDILAGNCADACSTFAPAECNGETACLCKKQRYANRLACCIYKNCSVEQQIPLFNTLSTACKDSGVDLRFQDRCFNEEAEAARSSVIALATASASSTTGLTGASPSTTPATASSGAAATATSSLPSASSPPQSNANSTPSSSSSSSGSSGDGGLPHSTILGLSIGIPLLLLFISLIAFLIYKFRRHTSSSSSPSPFDAAGKESPHSDASNGSEMYLHKRTSVLVTEELAPVSPLSPYPRSPRSPRPPGGGGGGGGGRIWDGGAKFFGTTTTAAKRLTGRYG